MSEVAQPIGTSLDQVVTRALWAALRTFGNIPGARVVDDVDVTLVYSETPHANFNNIIASAIDADAADHRIPEVLRTFAPASLPVTWWAGPSTRPTDLVARLQQLGLARQEPEFAMGLDLAAGWPEARHAPEAAVETVDRPAVLDEWLGVMHAAYGWPDARKSAIVRSMYLADLARPPTDRQVHHFVVRIAGRVVACSSLFVGGGEAFVTNIGTRPEARGQGLGTAATIATLELAAALGRTTATLTASVDGRNVYRRLGFVEAGVMERYVASAMTVGVLGSDGRRGGRR